MSLSTMIPRKSAQVSWLRAAGRAADYAEQGIRGPAGGVPLTTRQQPDNNQGASRIGAGFMRYLFVIPIGHQCSCAACTPGIAP